jgi:hypothetical protein
MRISFRGFIAKKLIKILGFSRGNVIQAVVFALPHFVMHGSASSVDIIIRIIISFVDLNGLYKDINYKLIICWFNDTVYNIILY